jgi:dipeptidyl aminopeptidase/acylaminoacyl peptidase
MILCYPVITLCDKTHLGTRTNLLANGNDTLENRIKYSIDQRVNSNTVPCFIWTTKTDNSVPYENTLMMIESLQKYQVNHKYHLFEKGPHGMALADKTAIFNGDTSYIDEEVATWVNKVDSFIKEVLK